MGMLIEGTWQDKTDRFMKNGIFQREPSAMPTTIPSNFTKVIHADPARFVLIASASCPWSHAGVLARVLKGLREKIPLQLAGGERLEGYGLMPTGPLSGPGGYRHVHQFYTETDANFTGRVTVPLLWDTRHARIVSNSSADIISAFDQAGGLPLLCPEPGSTDIQALIEVIFEGLSNAVYRAGLAQRQDEYDAAADSVFDTMQRLETRLSDQPFLFGTDLTTADIRLFATLVRFDTVYNTHFRCTRKRLVDHLALWRFTRRIFQMPGIADTVDFDEIRFGYYINDGNHNPSGIVAQQPKIDWWDKTGL